MSRVQFSVHTGRSITGHLRRRLYGLRTEGAGIGRETAAIGLGVVIGCLPFYGFHVFICWAMGSLLRLNRLKMYLAANVSNPLIAPWLILAEIQVGAWLRRGSFHSLSLTEVKATSLQVFGADVLAGAVLVGTSLGLVAALGTYATSRASSPDNRRFMQLVRLASDRYV